MENAKEELLKHIGERDVEVVSIIFGCPYDDVRKQIKGNLAAVLPMLDFEYDNGFGSQYLRGYIWYADGTWSERAEYDGSEWWEHKIRPAMDVDIDA
jgi:hypothetical protein